MSEASLAGVSAVKRLGVWGAILWPVKEWSLTTTQLKDWRIPPIQTEPALTGWGGFLMRGTAPQAVQAEAGQFQRHFFSVPPTYARVRGKRDHGSVKMCRADSDAPCLDLRAFMLTPA